MTGGGERGSLCGPEAGEFGEGLGLALFADGYADAEDAGFFGGGDGSLPFPCAVHLLRQAGRCALDGGFAQRHDFDELVFCDDAGDGAGVVCGLRAIAFAQNVEEG